MRKILYVFAIAVLLYSCGNNDPGNIQGTITDKTTNEAIQGAEVQLSTGIKMTTGANGQYDFIGLDAGEYSLKVTKAGYVDIINHTFEIEAGKTITENLQLEIIEEETGNIQGTITDKTTNENIQGAEVKLSAGITVTTTVNGKYEFTGLEAGEYTLNVTSEGYNAIENSNVIVEAGKTVTKDLQMEREEIEGMVFVQGGTFTMGCTDDECYDWELPTHQVTLSDFYIGKYEVTQKQWRDVMGTNPSYFTGDDLPVEQVSWNDIQEFLTKLNEQTGENYRLPTEAEWEYASRGGNKSNGYKYSGSNTASDVAWYSENSGSTTHIVGTKQPNELGIYDMSGNVWEWCSDWYGDYTDEAQVNPTGPIEGSFRVGRGGGWNYGAWYVRVAYRDFSYPGLRFRHLGFRLARSSK